MLHAAFSSRRAVSCYAHHFSTSITTTIRHSPLSHQHNTPVSNDSPNPLRPEKVRQINDQIALYVNTTKPSKSLLDKRREIIARLQRVVTSQLGYRYTVQPFGSTVYGVNSASSDLDLVLLDDLLPSGFHPERASDVIPEAYRLNRLARTVRAARFKDVYPIRASIPIVSGVEAKTGIHIDLNVNDRLGFTNTQMIKRYSELSPLIEPMLYFIKLWAKSHGLNSPSLGGKNRSLSSYAYALMTIGYLQHIRVLPNLQWASETSTINNHQGFWMKDKRDTKRFFCDIRYWQNGPADWCAARQDLSVAEALWGWFRYWGSEHEYRTSKMTIRLGGVVPRQAAFVPPPHGPSGGVVIPASSDLSTGVLWPYSLDEAGIRESLNAPDPAQWSHNLLIVEDPFIRTKNVGGNITNAVVEQLISKCQIAMQSLETNGSLEDILAPGPSRDTFQQTSMRSENPQHMLDFSK